MRLFSCVVRINGQLTGASFQDPNANRMLGHMSHNTNIQVRFVDTDALGHVNNSAFAHYAEDARIRFFQDLSLIHI